MKDKLIECFKDTLNQINSNSLLLTNTKNAITNSRPYYSFDDFSITKEANGKAEISVIEDTTFHAAQSLMKKHGRVAVLDFASAVNPGGGVMIGAMAQEECLCRSSNLLPCLKQKTFWNDFYMYHRNSNSSTYSDRVIYIKNITVFKTDDDIPQMLSENDWFNVDVIVCAAPNLSDKSDINENELKGIFDKRIKAILNTAIDNGVNAIVLGAFGCGAFKNPPQLVADTFKSVLIEHNYKNYFDEIVFAIKKSDNENFDIFRKTFDGLDDIYNEAKSIEQTEIDNHLEDNTTGKKFCPSCGAKINNDYKFCMMCGQNLQDDKDKSTELSTYEKPEKTKVEETDEELTEIIDDRYKIIRQVGKGASSVVYLAQDIKLERICAVKMVNKNTYVNKIAAQESLDEANKLKLLAHISIPQLYDIYDNDDRLYIVMEFIEGKNLSELIKTVEKPFEEYAIVNWAKQLCRVLFYLHTLKPPRIFRDLKPSNIILQPNGVIKLIDFGTMKFYDESRAEDTVNLGTKGYAAPEQFGGRGQTDARTDIYGLGMTMYHLITGVNPSQTLFDLKPINFYRKDISQGLEKIVMKCIEVDRGERYQSAMAVLNDLERIN